MMPSFLVVKKGDVAGTTITLVGDYAHDCIITPFAALPAFEAQIRCSVVLLN